MPDPSLSLPPPTPPLARCFSSSAQPGCTIQPVYGYSGEEKFLPVYCAGHKKEGMVSQKRECCLATRCYRRPSFGLPGEKGKYCVEHKVCCEAFFSLGFRGSLLLLLLLLLLL